jgi:hypothetical protein
LDDTCAYINQFYCLNDIDEPNVKIDLRRSPTKETSESKQANDLAYLTNQRAQYKSEGHDYRSLANKYYDLRQEYFDKANEAYNKGLGPVAQYYAEMVSLRKEKIVFIFCTSFLFKQV